MNTQNPILAAIISVLLPKDPYLSAEEKAEVERAVVDFVSAQIAGMATYMRVPYGMAMMGFNWMALRPYGRSFVHLDPVKQRDYLGMWIHSTLGVKRDFIKLIRSCALLCFYDHPVVLKHLDLDFT